MRSESILQGEPIAGTSRVHRGLPFALFVLAGLLIHLFGSSYHTLFPTNGSTLYKVGLAALFLVVTLVLYESPLLRRYEPIAFALFVGSCALLVNWALGDWHRHVVTLPAGSMGELALNKVSEMVPVVLVIIVLHRIGGRGPGSLYLQKGNLRCTLAFGLASFAGFAAVSVGILALQGGGADAGLGWREVLSATPWILLFVLANGFMEELWFRGLYLKKLEPFLGSTGALVATSLVFGAAHVGATYVSLAQRLAFPLLTAGIGYVAGLITQKTDSLWGAVLFHAGCDLVVVLSLLGVM